VLKSQFRKMLIPLLDSKVSLAERVTIANGVMPARIESSEQASLTMSPSVKHFMSTRQHALKEERHFALLEKSAESNQGRAFNQFQVRNTVRPMHLFGPTFDHDC
jgi:hypothetical protein